jgi:PPOX class probable F420-dependent enzyme
MFTQDSRRGGVPGMAATSKDGPELHPATVELAQGRNYGAITTVLSSGRLQTHPIWVGTDGERLVVNTEIHRQKYKNVERDPKVTLTIRDEENPYRYAEVRGEVVEKVTGQEARDHIDELSQKYYGEDYPLDSIESERVMLWIAPSRQTLVDQTAASID